MQGIIQKLSSLNDDRVVFYAYLLFLGVFFALKVFNPELVFEENYLLDMLVTIGASMVLFILFVVPVLILVMFGFVACVLYKKEYKSLTKYSVVIVVGCLLLFLSLVIIFSSDRDHCLDQGGVWDQKLHICDIGNKK